MKHRLRINVADRYGHKERIVQSGIVHIPRRVLRFLFGDFCEVLVLTPGQTVEGIEIHEIRNGDGHNETVRDQRRNHGAAGSAGA